ncbi:MAG TPA: hypothetical protein VJT15_16240 [Pyrinomonadaceae bacterium]|nr:hypothetical protein [Pyrinomonadaceae bacterium]
MIINSVGECQIEAAILVRIGVVKVIHDQRDVGPVNLNSTQSGAGRTT